MNNCEVDDAIEEAGVKERAEFKLEYEYQMTCGNLAAAYAALVAATARGLIGGHEGYQYQQRIVDVQLDRELDRVAKNN